MVVKMTTGLVLSMAGLNGRWQVTAGQIQRLLAGLAAVSVHAPSNSSAELQQWRMPGGCRTLGTLTVSVFITSTCMSTSYTVLTQLQQSTAEARKLFSEGGKSGCISKAHGVSSYPVVLRALCLWDRRKYLSVWSWPLL